MQFLVLLSALVACVAGVPFNTAKPKQDGRIVGGNPAQIEDHPHQVALLHYGSFLCGGSIISPTCVVTAAHCVAWAQSIGLTVRAGSKTYGFGGTIHNVTGGFYHGNFTYNNEYDVAVLRVDPPFTYSDSVHNIILEDSEISAGTNAVVTGWGETSTGGVSENLNEAILRMIDHDTCNAALYGSVTDKMVCTLPPSGIMGPCYNDGGGPLSTLYCPRRLVGIVSWNWDCGNPDYPAVYTKVSAVRNWIIHLCSAGIIPKGITKADAIP